MLLWLQVGFGGDPRDFVKDSVDQRRAISMLALNEALQSGAAPRPQNSNPANRFRLSQPKPTGPPYLPDRSVPERLRAEAAYNNARAAEEAAGRGQGNCNPAAGPPGFLGAAVASGSGQALPAHVPQVHLHCQS